MNLFQRTGEPPSVPFTVAGTVFALTVRLVLRFTFYLGAALTRVCMVRIDIGQPKRRKSLRNLQVRAQKCPLEAAYPCPQEQRARFRSAIPDVVDTQEAGRHGCLGPSTRRGPKRRPMCGTAETLRRAAAFSATEARR